MVAEKKWVILTITATGSVTGSSIKQTEEKGLTNPRQKRVLVSKPAEIAKKTETGVFPFADRLDSFAPFRFMLASRDLGLSDMPGSSVVGPFLFPLLFRCGWTVVHRICPCRGGCRAALRRPRFRDVQLRGLVFAGRWNDER